MRNFLKSKLEDGITKADAYLERKAIFVYPSDVSRPDLNTSAVGFNPLPVCDESCALSAIAAHLATTDNLVPFAPPSSSLLGLQPFEYEPLKPWQTRLVKLLPAPDGRMPACQLLTVEFIDLEGVGISQTGEIVKYQALSYVWGDTEKSYSIECNGALLPISRSLAHALHHLSQLDNELYLWCDGICIDQSNNAEKAFQVAQMLRVFEKADSVLAWMGELGAEDHIALQWIKRPDALISECKDKCHRAQCKEGWTRLQQSIVHLISQGIFLRTWIRQEFFAARKLTILSTNTEIDFQNFQSGIQILQTMKVPRFETRTAPGSAIASSQSLETSPASRAPQYETICQHLGHGGTDVRGYVPPGRRMRYSIHWLKTLNDGAYFDVSDARDRVYGVLGIITSPTTRLFVDDRSDTDPKTFPIDYGKSVSQVYQDVVKFLINTDRNLDVLTIFEDRRWQSEDLPSWVSDWRKQMPRGLLDVAPDTPADREKFLLAPIQDMEDYGRLALQGIYLSDLRDLSWARVQDFQTILQDSSSTAASALGLNRHSDLNHFIDTIKKSGYVSGSSYQSTFYSNVPGTTCLMDKVVLLAGGRCPFVLRELPNETFKFIGPVVTRPSPARQATNELRFQERPDVELRFSKRQNVQMRTFFIV